MAAMDLPLTSPAIGNTIGIQAAATIPLVGLVFLVSEITKCCRDTKKVIKQNMIPPGPMSWPVIGRIPEMMGNRPVFWWINCILEDTKTGIACIRLGDVHVIHVTCPQIAQEILKKQDVLFEDRHNTMASQASCGGYLSAVITPHSEQWKKMRKVLTSYIKCRASRDGHVVRIHHYPMYSSEWSGAGWSSERVIESIF